MDDQWRLWVKLGVRKLVLKEDIPSGVADHKSEIVKTTMPEAGLHFVSKQVPPLEYQLLPHIDASVHTSLEGFDNIDFENNLEHQSGDDILHELGWGSSFCNPVPLTTTVRC